MTEKKTSTDWQKEYPFIVLDAYGWDRQNFDYSWGEELITQEEFTKRAWQSTCIMREGF